MRDRQKRKLVVALTVVMTLVWSAFPASEIAGYVTGESYTIDSVSLVWLRLAWVFLSLVTIPTLVLTRITPTLWPWVWRVWVIGVMVLFTGAVLFDSSAAEQPPDEPGIGYVLLAFCASFTVCGPAVWFNIVKPLRQRWTHWALKR